MMVLNPDHAGRGVDILHPAEGETAVGALAHLALAGDELAGGEPEVPVLHDIVMRADIKGGNGEADVLPFRRDRHDMLAQGPVEQLKGPLDAPPAPDAAAEHALEISRDVPGADIVAGDIADKKQDAPVTVIMCNEKITTDLVEGAVEDPQAVPQGFGNKLVHALVDVPELLQAPTVGGVLALQAGLLDRLAEDFPEELVRDRLLKVFKNPYREGSLHQFLFALAGDDDRGDGGVEGEDPLEQAEAVLPGQAVVAKDRGEGLRPPFLEKGPGLLGRVRGEHVKARQLEAGLHEGAGVHVVLNDEDTGCLSAELNHDKGSLIVRERFLWQPDSLMPDILQHFRPEHWRFLEGLAADCASAGGQAFLVGGCLRSALLGEAVLDFDVEVFGLSPSALEKILSRQGRFSRVGKAFGIYKLGDWPVDVGLPRTERKAGSGHCGFEIDIRPDMPVPEAAKRRDFTLNAIYFNILKQEIVDPLGGMEDLRKQRLRHCSDRFPEDPLRVLRAMQFAARIPAEVHPATTDLCARLSPENLSRERYYAEWEKLILSGKEPSRGLDFLRHCRWLRFFPELEAMVGCPQEPRWHPEGDVWTHTLHCMDAFARGRTGRREEDLIVGFAVLCHDMGKPLTTEQTGDRIRSPGHESAGIVPAESFLQRLNVSRKLQEQILPLVRCHMRPASLYKERSSASAIRRLARDCGRLDLLLRVFQADAAGRPPRLDNSGEATDWLRAQARELSVEKGKPHPLLGGKDLLARGWAPGPALGRFLKAAYEEQLNGAFTDREGALAWLDAHCGGTSSSSDIQPSTES